MIKVAVTGNIASGKSQVERFISELGYFVVDADKLGHQVLLDYKEEIIPLFENDDILDESGEISRIKLGNIVFFDEEKKKNLEKFSHKKIREKICELFLLNKDKELVFVAVPLLFEAEMENLFDKIIFVSAPESIRVDRLMKRNNYTKEQAMARINSQQEEQEKIKKSDFVINNNSDLENLKQLTIKTIEQLI